MNEVIFRDYVKPDLEALRASDCQHEWSYTISAGNPGFFDGFRCLHCSLTLGPNTLLYIITELAHSEARARMLLFSLYSDIEEIRQTYENLKPDDKISGSVLDFTFDLDGKLQT